MKSAFFLTLFLLAFSAGCGDSGPPLGAVTGKVTLYGKPYPNAIVSFTPEGGGPAATSSTDQNGDFELWSAGKKGAVIGTHKVSVTTVKEVKETKSMAEVRSDDPAYAASLAESSSNAAYKAAANEKEKIPAKYNVNTELSKDVTSGTNKIDLDLK